MQHNFPTTVIIDFYIYTGLSGILCEQEVIDCVSRRDAVLD